MEGGGKEAQVARKVIGGEDWCDLELLIGKACKVKGNSEAQKRKSKGCHFQERRYGHGGSLRQDNIRGN